MQEQQSPLKGIFESMETVPSQMYFALAIGSIVLSAVSYLMGRRTLALFIGEWAPTFLALPLFYKLLKPSREEMGAGLRQAVEEARRTA